MDNSAQPTHSAPNSYVNDYTPPQPMMADDSGANGNVGQSANDIPVDSDSNMVFDPLTQTNKPREDFIHSNQALPFGAVDYSQPDVPPVASVGSTDQDMLSGQQPASDFAMSSSDQPSVPQGQSEALEDQNIFFLLGAEDGADEDKETFLDELQQVIWEDFIENDVELLITTEELTGLRKILPEGSDNTDNQEEVAEYLEGLIPDLEEIMLEKALELKEDMVRERIAGMRDYFTGQQDKLQVIDEAEQLANQNQWRSAAVKLNTLAA